MINRILATALFCFSMFIFSKILKIDTPYPVQKGRIKGVFYLLSSNSDLYTIVAIEYIKQYVILYIKQYVVCSYGN